MSLTTSPTLATVTRDPEPGTREVGFTFRAAWPEAEQGTAVIAIGEIVDAVRSAVASRLHSARTSSQVITADDPHASSQPGDLIIDQLRRQVLDSGRQVRLTYREFELLAFLADHPDRVLTRDQILDALGARDAEGGRTIDVHVARLRRKISNAREALETVRGVGYRWRGGVVDVLVVSG